MSGVIGVVVGALIGGTAAWMVGFTDGWDGACDTITKNLEQLNGDDSLTVNLIREIVTNLKGGDNVHSD